MFKRVIKIIIALVCFALILAAAVFASARYFNEAPQSTSGTVIFEVKSGESARETGRRLEDEGIIRSRYFWYLLNRFEEGSLKAGTYRIEVPASQIAIHALLVKGQQTLVKVTIPEGVTLSKTARIFDEAGICSEAAFLDAAANEEILAAYQIPGETMEGYLFPDTYLFQEEYPAEKVVRVMADTFFKRLGALSVAGKEPDSGGLSPQELFEKVILASIIEREYRVDEEAALMAGVFYNRLAIGMPLQSCATVEYIITEIQGKPHPEVLYTRDTEIKNPYNTYVYRGLPPGPISAPGTVALLAVFNPAPSDYRYFRLIDPGAGRHYFSKTFDDHIQAGQLYVKGNR
jgi:UPF0755 protein